MGVTGAKLRPARNVGAGEVPTSIFIAIEPVQRGNGYIPRGQTSLRQAAPASNYVALPQAPAPASPSPLQTALAAIQGFINFIAPKTKEVSLSPATIQPASAAQIADVAAANGLKPQDINELNRIGNELLLAMEEKRRAEDARRVAPVKKALGADNDPNRSIPNQKAIADRIKLAASLTVRPGFDVKA